MKLCWLQQCNAGKRQNLARFSFIFSQFLQLNHKLQSISFINSLRNPHRSQNFQGEMPLNVNLLISRNNLKWFFFFSFFYFFSDIQSFLLIAIIICFVVIVIANFSVIFFLVFHENAAQNCNEMTCICKTGICISHFDNITDFRVHFIGK